MLTGGCFCGRVRYEVTGVPYNATNCHCAICRRASGAPFVAWFSVKRGEFRIVAGEPASFRSSDHGTRRFCSQCGTQIIFASTDFPDEVDVTTGSLDDPNAVPPRDHTRTSSRLGWLDLDDGLPEFQEGRADG
jgi:hypothetical protein